MFRATDTPLEIKDIDNVSRRVTVVLSKFGNIDEGGDVITMGAFSKSIKEHGPESQSNRKIKFLRYHDFSQPIGVWESLEETHDGLIGVGKLGRSTLGTDALHDYEDGIITEHSVGYKTIQDKTFLRPEGIRELKEVQLWEASAVTFGMNPETPVLSVGKGNSIEYLDKLNKKMNGLVEALKNGKGTDERLQVIEMNLRVCQTQYNSLINIKSVDKPLITDKPNKQTKLIITNIF